MAQVANWIINLIASNDADQQPEYVWQPDTNLEDASLRQALSTCQMD